MTVAAPPLPPISTQRQRVLIARLQQLAATRAKEEVVVRRRRIEQQDQAQEEYVRERDAKAVAFEQRHAELVAEFKRQRDVLLTDYEARGTEVAIAENEVIELAAARYSENLDSGRQIWQMRCAQITTTYKQQKVIPQQRAGRFFAQCDNRDAEITQFHQAAIRLVQRRCAWPEDKSADPVIPPGATSIALWEEASATIARGQTLLQNVQNLRSARFNEDGWPILIFIFTLVAGLWPAWIYIGPHGWYWAIATMIAGPALLAAASWAVARPFAQHQTRQSVPGIQQAVRDAFAFTAAARNAAKEEALQAKRELKEKKQRDLLDQNDDWNRAQQKLGKEQQDAISAAAQEYGGQRQKLEQKFEPELDRIEALYPPQIAQTEQSFLQEMERLSAAYRTRLKAIEMQFEQEWTAILQQWNQGLAEIQQEIAAMQHFCATHFLPWIERDASERGFSPTAASGEIEALQLGKYAFHLEVPTPEVDNATTSVMDPSFSQMPATLGVSWEQPPETIELPAVLSYPDSPSLLLEAEAEGRDNATQVLQNAMLRLLTTFPPGKVRFTILDPVGLGQNFSAFMHLADFDDRLVANRIWTEQQHIQQRLIDLTEHMENVIQKYLRNEFASIQEYNRHAGEVAEPFQILVIANFPNNFSDEAARRLASIANSGARCGVYTLISVDTRQKMPRGFELSDLESQATTLVWDEQARRFCWQQEDLRSLPLELELLPDDARMTELIRSVGKLAKSASRVEVPFTTILPPDDKWWAGDSRSEIEVPLGRAGATKLQFMRLGKGTSQHVLISGKTGSGKSTLLNALITNLAIHYSPDELEFYLIDFKKGVEFKAYASEKLPHARVIAIESEREFGLSVLERLDLELKRRGDLFRKHGVQDVKGYRAANPDAAMPRVLLIIDEFQEFFTSDDKISHESSLFLDRLVRQGRAFGIHVLLGSQTLAGAYSLARSTLGQMAVRVALQCSETDAHLILSEDNTAARLLSRPGEAIYNDANGLLEGNHPFQVVWLSDMQREGYLRQVRELAQQRNWEPRPTTIFEGNVAADQADNPQLLATLARSESVPALTPPRIWLGSAVAIKDPPYIDFQRQSGCNLLVVGQQEELAAGILSTACLALAAQVNPIAASTTDGEPLKSLYVLDGTRTESPDADLWTRVTEHVADRCEVVQPRGVEAIITRLAAEVDRRVQSGRQDESPLFLVIYNLARFRDLKKGEEFSFDDAGSGGGKNLANILREGPAVGVHVLCWADSFSNASRWLERSSLRDLDLRVLFQMSASDSSNLMDSPAASRLGISVALFTSEERGQAEKFRPYAIPTQAWLNSFVRPEN